MAGNSWQQPVAGEPSWGTLHTHIETLVDTNPTVTTDVTVTVTNAPTGAKGIAGFFSVWSDATAHRYGYIKDAAANTWVWATNPHASSYGVGWFVVPLDSNKQFKWSVDNADVSSFRIFMRGYYI